MTVYSKKYSRCDVAIATGLDPMDHEDYPRNYKTGSSKTMEASATLELIKELRVLGVGVGFIVSDDDSTICAHLQHVGTIKKRQATSKHSGTIISM